MEQQPVSISAGKQKGAGRLRIEEAGAASFLGWEGFVLSAIRCAPCAASSMQHLSVAVPPSPAGPNATVFAHAAAQASCSGTVTHRWARLEQLCPICF